MLEAEGAIIESQRNKITRNTCPTERKKEGVAGGEIAGVKGRKDAVSGGSRMEKKWGRGRMEAFCESAKQEARKWRTQRSK
jgi:hypothetical protein